MSKPDRVVVAGLPHHITHRGNRREQIFRETDDYQTYLRLLRKAIERHDVWLWSYSLMPNHVHLVAVPARQIAGKGHALGIRQLRCLLQCPARCSRASMGGPISVLRYG